MQYRRIGGLVGLALLLATLMSPVAEAGAMGVSSEPRHVDFGQVSVNCFSQGTCPTRVLTFTNTSRQTAQIVGLSSCGRVVGQSCTTSPRFPGWGGMLLPDDEPISCYTPLEPGDSCSLTIIGIPDTRGPIHGTQVAWMLTGDGLERIGVRVPVAIRGV